MHKLKIYLDTSVISYLDQTDAPEKMAETRQLWEMFREKKYDVYLSETTMQEINECDSRKRHTLYAYLSQIDYTLIDTTAEIREMANKFLELDVLKKKSYDDCLHIASAIIGECDIIISWNFKHIVNAKTIRGVRVITTMTGYRDLSVFAPPSLLEYEEDDNDETT